MALKQRFAAALIGLPGYWATIPQATEGPRFCGTFVSFV
jgi:hypothetical protein